MPDNFESGGTRPNQPQFNLEDFDFDKIYRLVRFGLGLLALVLLWMAVSWGHDFYTDWLRISRFTSSRSLSWNSSRPGF